MFWETMTPGGGVSLGRLSAAIKADLGGFNAMVQAVTAAGVSRFGSGWAWLVVNDGKLEVLSTPNQDNPLMDGKTPLLGVDVWEHAYYLLYQNMRPAYLEAWWNTVNWDVVTARYDAATS
jgi:Fe-Mn family superoxide dismutase